MSTDLSNSRESEPLLEIIPNSRKYSAVHFLKENRKLIQYVTCILVYMLLGASVMVVTEDFSWIEGFHFSVVTLTTIGYGNETPNTPGVKLFCVFYIVLGITAAATALGNFIAIMIQRHQSGTLEPPTTYRPMLKRIGFALCGQIFLLLLGTFFLCLAEKRSFIDGLYWSMVTLSTVGYGDITDGKSLHTKLFGIFYIIFGVTFFSYSFGTIADALADIFLLKNIRQMADQGVTDDILTKMDVLGDGRVSKEEFLRYMLVELNFCAKEEIGQIDHLFISMDVDNSGFLDRDDIKKLVEKKNYIVN